MNNNNNHENGRNFNRRFSRSIENKAALKEKDHIQNLNISIDELIKHLNLFEYFFSMELVKKIKNYYNKKK
jgi:hypothetical protein